MTESERYFIKSGYVENPVVSYDLGPGRSYWHPARVRTAVSHQRAVYKWAVDIARERKPTSIADVGCGFAYKLNMLHHEYPEAKYCGIDQPSAINLCREKYEFGTWVATDFENSPTYPNDTFDIVISSDVIEHLYNPDALLDYIKRVVSSDGLILISTPERDLLRGVDNYACPNNAHVREWNRAELSLYLQDRGFEIIEHRILPARQFNLSKGYIKKALWRLAKGKSMRYSQTVLARFVR